jgi:hypothetical protein
VGVYILLIVGSALHQRLDFNVTIVIFLGFDMSNLVGRTNSYVVLDCTPQHPPKVIDNERLPLPSGASGPAADAVGCRQEHTLFCEESARCEPPLVHLERTPQEAQE